MRRLRNAAYKHGLIRNLERLARGLKRLPANAPNRRGLERIDDVSYGPLPEHKLDVYRPAERSGPCPVMIYIHGGGFQFFDKNTHWAAATKFATQGYVVFNVDYRLAPTHRYPAAVEDAALALKWVADNAARFGGDISRLALAGESAGANLVTGLAIAACWRRPEPWAMDVWQSGALPSVLLPACGYMAVSEPQRHREAVDFPAWMESRIQNVSDTYLPGHTPALPEHDFANPLFLLERLESPERPFPATFAFSGDKDPVYGDTLRLKPAVARHGSAAEAIVYPDGIHTFHMLMTTELARQAWRDQLAFLHTHMPDAP